MAERRMLKKSFFYTDRYFKLSAESQLLYIHLVLNADDDGFVDNPCLICRITAATEDDLRSLIENGYLISFDSGIVVIKHWRMHNTVQKDRYKETVYKKEKSSLCVDSDGIYFMAENSMDTDCIQEPEILDPQVRLGKDSIVKVSIGEVSSGKEKEEKSLSLSLAREEKSADKRAYGEFKNVMLSEEEYLKLKKDYSCADRVITELSDYMRSKGAEYQDHYATLRIWCRDKRRDKASDKGSSPPVKTVKPEEEEDEFLKMAATQRQRRLKEGICGQQPRAIT
ncbi:MAG: replisome organizer [Ruminococcaceae bacterium]|nr:replisome organizer [Oscillospiraceae bacterium]